MLGVLGAFQLALACGAPWGKFAWGGQHPGTLPRDYRFASAASVVIVALFAGIILQRAGVISPLSDAASLIGLWIFIGYMGIGTIMNGISRSRPERIWSPYSIAMLLLALPLLP